MVTKLVYYKVAERFVPQWWNFIYVTLDVLLLQEPWLEAISITDLRCCCHIVSPCLGHHSVMSIRFLSDNDLPDHPSPLPICGQWLITSALWFLRKWFIVEHLRRIPDQSTSGCHVPEYSLPPVVPLMISWVQGPRSAGAFWSVVAPDCLVNPPWLTGCLLPNKLFSHSESPSWRSC